MFRGEKPLFVEILSKILLHIKSNAGALEIKDSEFNFTCGISQSLACEYISNQILILF